MKKLNKITVTGTYTPETNEGSTMIGGKTFAAGIAAKADVTEDGFKILIEGTKVTPPWFKMESHNYEDFLASRGRGIFVAEAEPVVEETTEPVAEAEPVAEETVAEETVAEETAAEETAAEAETVDAAASKRGRKKAE